MNRGLNERQRRFADNVLQGMSQKEAYLSAGYNCKEEAAERAGSRLLRKVEVQAYLAEQRKKLTERVLMSAEKVVELFTRQATWLPAEIVTHEITCPRDIAKLPEATQVLIEGWHYDSKGRFVLEFVDRQHALDQLGKIFGVFQADAQNWRDKEPDLMAELFWQWVMSHHVATRKPIPALMTYADAHPEEVQAWGRETGALPPGEEVV